ARCPWPNSTSGLGKRRRLIGLRPELSRRTTRQGSASPAPEENTMATHDTATAHQLWQERCASAAGRAGWVEPEADVIAVAARLREQAQLAALDLGCGVGRHALYLATQGFVVSAYDASDNGIEVTRAAAQQHGLSIALANGQMTALPYQTGQFDYV